VARSAGPSLRLWGVLLCASLIGASSCTNGNGLTSPDPSNRVSTSVTNLPAPPVVFPEDAGVIDVKRDFGATGDGRNDDTAAIQSAISTAAENEGTSRGRVLYFPPGEYLVSDTLEWRTADGAWSCCISLQGAGRGLTTIRLSSAAVGFTDAASPRAVIRTASHRSALANGAGNEAFRNSIYDLTVDVGSDNPGAVGIDWLANNIGAIRRVSIVSTDRNLSGRAGISMTRRWPGPGMISDVSIVGFDYGMEIDNWQYSVTLEHVELRGQRITGLMNVRNALVIRDLRSENVNPAITCGTPDAAVTLIDSSLSGGLSSATALTGRCSVFLQNVTASGYRSATETAGPVVAMHAEASDGTEIDAGVPLLTAEEAPVVPIADLTEWVNVRDFGANPDDHVSDDDALRSAFATGKSTVYLPPGSNGYVFDRTVEVPSTVRHIAGMESVISQSSGGTDVVWEVADETDEPLVIERVAFNLQGKGMAIRMNGARPVVIRDAGVGVVDATAGGHLYLDNVVALLELGPEARAWARQLNTEGAVKDNAGNLNHGGDLWVLGLKTESAITAISTDGGGRTEVLGGFLYPTVKVGPDIPAFFARDASQRVAYLSNADRPDSNYEIQLEIVNDGSSSSVATAQTHPRGSTTGWFVVDASEQSEGRGSVTTR
jgi:hypothetical protein